MNLFDKLALQGRRYTLRRSPAAGEYRLSLLEVLQMFNARAILELSTYLDGKHHRTVKPDADKKLKISLLDELSDMNTDRLGWYEVYETAPTGDLTKAKVIGHSSDNSIIGETRMLLGRRTLSHYFLDDPLLQSADEPGQQTG